MGGRGEFDTLKRMTRESVSGGGGLMHTCRLVGR